MLDEKTIAYADFRGNRQYLSAGNLNANNRISLFLMDYPHGLRLKIWGEAHIVHEGENPDLFALLADPNHSGKVERAIVIRVEAFDWNCSQHITPRYTQRELEAIMNDVEEPVIR